MCQAYLHKVRVFNTYSQRQAVANVRLMCTPQRKVYVLVTLM